MLNNHISQVEHEARETLKRVMRDLYVENKEVNSWLIDALESHLYLLAFDAFRLGRLEALESVQSMIEEYDRKYQNLIS